MIKHIILKSGSSNGQLPMEFDLTPITVFVGPNNSGKSKVLVEIENQTRTGKINPTNLVLSSVTFIAMSADDIKRDLERLKAPFLSEFKGGSYQYIGKLNPQNNSMGKVHISPKEIIQEAQNPGPNNSSYSQYLGLYTLRLDGTNRLNLLHEQEAGDLQTVANNHLSYLFANNDVREEVRRIVFDAFWKYYVIDPTNMGKLRVRLSVNPPSSERIEKGWEAQSVDFHSKATLMSEASDGVRAFSGIITTPSSASVPLVIEI